MAGLSIAAFAAFTFDVYGTLIDWEPAITSFLLAWAERNGVVASGEELLLAYDRARALVQTERPTELYPEILRRSFDRVCAAFHVASDTADREVFAQSPKTWPAYPDSHASLLALQAHGKIGALSNIDDDNLRASLAKLGVHFDLLVTAERVGAYKPHGLHFRTALDDLSAMGIPRTRVLHIAQSLRADITPANRLGLSCVWVRRPGRILGLAGEGVGEAKPDLTVSGLAELVVALGATTPLPIA